MAPSRRTTPPAAFTSAASGSMAGQDNGAAPPAVGVIGIAATGPPAGYPRTIIGLTGHLAALSLLTAPLTGPGPGAPATRAEAYLRAHGERGLAAADASTATLAGLRQVRWEQTYRGIPVLDGEVRVNLDAAGRVLNVVGARRTPRLASTRPAVGRAEAVRDAGGGRAELIIEGGRLAWSVTDGPEHTVVDATSGALVPRTSLRRQDAVPVWVDYPGGRAGSVELTSYISSTTQLKNRWIYAFSDTDPNDEPDPGEDVAPGAYPFHSIACPPVLCSWTPSTDDWEQNREQNAVQAFYLANRFREYLAGPRIGFDGFKDDDPVLLNTD